MIDGLKLIFAKLRVWGMAGVVGYAKGWLTRRRIRRFFLRNARKHRDCQPVFGYTLVDDFTQVSSHNKAMRDFARSLKDAGIPFQTYDTNQRAAACSPNEINGILTPVQEFNIRRYSHVAAITPPPLPRVPGVDFARIVFWEFESGLLSACPDLPHCTTVIAMSDFNANHYRGILPPSVHVRKILYPFHSIVCAEDDCRAVRAKYGLRPDDFMVFFNFDFGSSYYRKNPEGTLRAFALALHDKPNARLVFKTMRAERRPDLVAQLMALARELGVADRLVLISDYLPEREIFALTGACDAYVSLHRGEGFGITLAEAMAMGRPVICTDYSSTTEFCHPDCTLPVPYTMVPVRPEQIDNPCYRDVAEWPEPDVAAAAAALRKLYGSPALRAEIGTRARQSVNLQFSTENFRQSIVGDRTDPSAPPASAP